MDQLQNGEPDIFCLQEVTEDFIKQFKNTLKKDNNVVGKIPYRLYCNTNVYQLVCLVHERYRVEK